MRTAFTTLIVVSVAASVQVDYLAPVSGGYIYRSDNNGPASLIHLGAVPYQQPLAFAPPLPLTQSLGAQLNANDPYNLAAVPLPYIANKPIVVEEAEEDDHDDDDDDIDEEYLDAGDYIEPHGEDHSQEDVFEKGTGSEYDEQHFKANGEKGSKGYNSNDHHVVGKSGHYGKEHNEGFYVKGNGEEKRHHNEADVNGKFYENGDNYNGGDQGHKKHSSKGEDVSGYHKVFHKDEFKKDHDFYDISDNSGRFKKYDQAHEKHGSEEGGHNEGNNEDLSFKKSDFGKAGFHAKGHDDESHEGRSAKDGHDSHYNHEEESGRKGGKSHEREYVYDDDLEDD